MIQRRTFLTGLAAALAAPTPVLAQNIMPVRVWRPVLIPDVPSIAYGSVIGMDWTINSQVARVLLDSGVEFWMPRFTFVQKPFSVGDTVRIELSQA